MEQRNLRDRDGQVVVPPDRALSRGGRGSSSGRPTPTHQHPAKHRSPTSYQPRHLVIIITTIILSVVLTTPSSASKPLSYSSIGDHAPSSGTSGDEGQGRDARRCNTRSTGHPLPPHQLPTEHSQLQIYQQYTTSLMAIVVTSLALPSHSGINANDLGWPPSSGGSNSDGQRCRSRRPDIRPLPPAPYNIPTHRRPTYSATMILGSLMALHSFNGMAACKQSSLDSGSYNTHVQIGGSSTLELVNACYNSMKLLNRSRKEVRSYNYILQNHGKTAAHTGNSEKCTNELFPYQSKDNLTVHHKDNTKCVINLIIRI